MSPIQSCWLVTLSVKGAGEKQGCNGLLMIFRPWSTSNVTEHHLGTPEE